MVWNNEIAKALATTPSMEWYGMEWYDTNTATTATTGTLRLDHSVPSGDTQPRLYITQT